MTARRWLWTGLVGWMYGVPFLLIVGEMRRRSDVGFLADDQEQLFQVITGVFIWGGLILNLLPLTGYFYAQLRGDDEWRARFLQAFMMSLLIYFAALVVASIG
jgi:hypothetical protein